MGSGIKMSVLLFSFALISAISIDDLPVKPVVVIDEKSVEYKLDDLNIIQPMFFVIPKDRNESFVGPPEHNERKLLENIQLDAEEYDEDDESDDENTGEENSGSRRLLKKAPKKAPSPPPAPKKAPSPAPAPKKAPSPAPAPKKAPSPPPAPKKAPSPAPAPKKAPSPAPAPKKAPSPAPTTKKAPSPAPAPKKAPSPAPAPKVSVNIVPVVAVSPSKVLKSKPAPQNFKIFMTCDNEFDLYVNGEKVGKGDTWTTTYEFNTIVKSGDIIAIDGVDKGGPAGFIGVFNGKITKPADWKCSTQKSDNWNKNNFDDSKWSSATSYGKNNGQNIWMTVGRGSRPNIPSDAEWLWTNNNENHDRVYCRFFYHGKPAPIVESTNNKKLDDWLNTDKGKEAVDFCKSLGITNNNRVYMGCLEDMMVIKDKNIAKESALSAEEVISSDHEGTNRRFCQASGDPHVTNYDGSYFHIQEQGIYTVAKTDGFEVQEKMKKNGANKVGVPSCMTGAVVKSGSVIIEVDVYNYKKVIVNGESVDIPEGLTKTFGGVQVKYGKQTIEWKGQKATATGMKIITKNGFMVMIEGSYCGVLEVNVPISYYGKMSGICGNADGNKNGDDFCGSDGKVMDVNYGKKKWEMSGYGGPTAPLSKWQLSWKPLGSSCYFVSGCESATSSSIPIVIKKAPSPEPVVPSKPVAPVVPKLEPVVPSKPVAPVIPSKPVAPVIPSKQVEPVVPSKPVAPVVPKSEPVAPKKNKEDKTSKKVEQIIKDMKENHQLSTDKIKSLKTNVFKLINNEQKKLESELSDSKNIVLLTENDVKKLKEKYENKIKEYRTLNQTISTLEQKMKEHYQQMDSDSKYLLLLEKIKPSFLGTLQSFGKIAINVKNTIVNNVVEGVDKEYMLRVLYEMTEPAKNSTSVLSTEFINHYNKYKRRIGVDKDMYEKEYNELLVFREKYKSERKLKNLLLKDYKNALNILNKLRTSYMLDEEDIREFEKLSIFIKNIFDYKKC